MALLGIANLGHRAGVNRDQVAQDLAGHAHGTRQIAWREILAAVNKAFDSPSTITPLVHTLPSVDGVKLLNGIVDRGALFTEGELWESSPVRIDWRPEDDAIAVLRRLYRPEEQLFIGKRYEAGAEHFTTWLLVFHCKSA